MTFTQRDLQTGQIVRKLNTLDLPADGSVGNGFIVQELDLNTAATTSESSKMLLFPESLTKITTGNEITGEITVEAYAGDNLLAGYFNVSPTSSFKFLITKPSEESWESFHYAILAADRPVSYENASKYINSHENSGFVDLWIASTHMTLSVLGQDIQVPLSFIDGDNILKIEQDGTNLSWFFNDELILQTPQNPNETFFNIFNRSPSYDAQTFKLRYDLKKTVYEKIIIPSDLKDGIYYKLLSGAYIFEKYINEGDFIQFYNNRTGLIIHRQ